MMIDYTLRKLRMGGLALLAMLGVIAALPAHGEAATSRRFSIDDRGNFMIFGNTVGFDCRDNRVEKPIVGSVPIGLLGLFSCNGILPDGDTGVDIFWRSEAPGNGQAAASNLIDPGAARSTAIFALPANAKIVMARLYWAAQRTGGFGAGTQVTLERPAIFSRQIMGEATAAKTLNIAGLDYYQSSADVTRELQQWGSGAYRVSGIQTIDVRTRDKDVAFVAWNIVVVYHLDSEPIRNIAVFDGLERVAPGSSSTTNVTLNGFSVPTSGYNARLGVIAYEGDNEITGDQLRVNGTAISNTNNPANNFFNRSSTVLDALAPRVGDLPQMSGRPSSMSGYDADTIDITNQIAGDATSIALTATTSGDEYFLGVFATAVTTIRPVFTSTTKTVVNLDRTDGRFLPGDMLEFTIATKNTGNDTAKFVTITDVLPQGLTMVLGAMAIKYTVGAGAGDKSDTIGDDQAEYDPVTRRITARVGTGANITTGGDLAMDAEAAITFRVTIDPLATGTIFNQAFVNAIGMTASTQGQTVATQWPSGNGTNPNAPTGITISTCNTNADCPVTSPICDTTGVHKCVCNSNADCPNPLVCNPTTQQCVECIPGMNGTCNPNGPGGVCLTNSTCGCNNNTDCGGRICDTVNHICAAVNTDLSVTLTRTPPGNIATPGTMLTYTMTVANNGGVPINGAKLDANLAPNLQGPWTCVGVNGAVCPVASGTGQVDALVSLPAGGQLVYTFNVTTSTDPVSSTLDFTGSLQPPRGYVDTNPADNVVTDSIIIGIPPLGPDLTVTVREEPSETDSSVNYIIEVTNHGPGIAPGATVIYDVPAGAEVVLTPGEGWTCERPNNGPQVICTRTQPIPEGMASPIVIKVIGQPNQPSLPLKVTVTASDDTGSPLSDPNPGDNTVERTTTLNQFKLLGGGFAFGCSMGPGDSGSNSSYGATLCALAALLGLALMTRAARRNQRRQFIAN